MKKMILLGALMASAAAGFAQESRQDVSVSGFYLLPTTVRGTGNVDMFPTTSAGVLASYRFLLTPRSALEVNYSWAQNTNYFTYSGTGVANPVKARQQEFSGAYVFGLSFKRYNPYLEAGIGAIVNTPILVGTYSLDTKQKTNIGGVFGGGVAYELSPSFDIRVGYHGILVKAPNYNSTLTTSRYEVVSLPAVGIAYHF